MSKYIEETLPKKFQEAVDNAWLDSESAILEFCKQALQEQREVFIAQVPEEQKPSGIGNLEKMISYTSGFNECRTQLLTNLENI